MTIVSNLENPSKRKNKDRGLKFNEKHALKYGLSICSRNAKTSVVETVMCKFCVAFGKESAADMTRKRRATSNIKYFRQPFRADHYLSHLEINHKQKWAEYERASGAEKESFFAHPGTHQLTTDDETTASSNPLMGLYDTNVMPEQQDSQSQPMLAFASHPSEMLPPHLQSIGPVRLPILVVEKAIVDNLVRELFWNAQERPASREVVDMFVPKTSKPEAEVDMYEIVIKNQRLYDLAIKFVTCGASYRLISRLIQCTREETKINHYGGCSEHKIAGYIRAVLASNLQKMALMMRSSWAYAIATDAAVHQGTSYLDIRIRLWQSNALHDFHLMTLPTFDQHPAPVVMQRLEHCLNVLDPQWRSKLLGTTTNGGISTGRNAGMTGSQQGLAARLTSLVTNAGFYLIWSGVHQLEAVVKNAVMDFCHRAFYDQLIAVLATLRHPQHASALPGLEDLPDLAKTSLHAKGFCRVLILTLKWLLEHRTQAVQCLQSSQPPSPMWWVAVASCHRLLAEVDYFMNKLVAIEHSLHLVTEQVQELCKLALIMADVVGARRDLWKLQAPQDACAAGTFVLTYQNAQQYIQNEGGHVAIEMFDTLQGVERQQMATSVAHFAVDLIAGVAIIAQEGRHYCAEDAGVIVNPPVVLPYDVYKLGQKTFRQIVATQRNRLRTTYTDEQLTTLVHEYDEFVLAVEQEPILNGILKKHDRETDVSFAWSCLHGRFRLLQTFVGTLATVLPDLHVGTLASDLSQWNWEKPDYRQTMLDFSLEGILHARQKLAIELIDIQHTPSSHLQPEEEEEDEETTSTTVASSLVAAAALQLSASSPAPTSIPAASAPPAPMPLPMPMPVAITIPQPMAMPMELNTTTTTATATAAAAVVDDQSTTATTTGGFMVI